MDKTSKYIKTAVDHVVKKLNSDLSKEPKCANLTLNEIDSARKSYENLSIDYLVSFSVLPSHGQFEATVRCDEDCRKPKVIEEVSRINLYGTQSDCINDSYLRKYCYCL